MNEWLVSDVPPTVLPTASECISIRVTNAAARKAGRQKVDFIPDGKHKKRYADTLASFNKSRIPLGCKRRLGAPLRMEGRPEASFFMRIRVREAR